MKKLLIDDTKDIQADKSCNKLMEKFLIDNGYKKETGWSFKRIIDNEKT